ERGSRENVPGRVVARWSLPAKGAVGERGVLHGGERPDGRGVEYAHAVERAAIQVCAGQAREVVAGAEQPGVSGDAAECRGVLVVHLATQVALPPRIHLRRRDARAVTRGRQVPRLAHAERTEDVR